MTRRNARRSTPQACATLTLPVSARPRPPSFSPKAERRSVTFPTFFEWLCAQSRRADDVGTLAQHARKDKLFPRYAQHLYLFLLRYEHLPVLRASVKKAHAEYRRARREGVAA